MDLKEVYYENVELLHLGQYRGIWRATVNTTMSIRTVYNIQRIPGALSLGVKRPGREADH
jgi:hypothetical protein